MRRRLSRRGSALCLFEPLIICSRILVSSSKEVTRSLIGTCTSLAGNSVRRKFNVSNGWISLGDEFSTTWSKGIRKKYCMVQKKAFK
ncbi:hypothetical protein FocTR4_00016573 [Fusarium oxysporum f. sp. cubense]|uniref:Secreted protein n=1 Tax=Fusarium oxysporum f. sp. cubense TaxID=61366 RepID=A0A5C6SCM4_FUSOC|nr:hypothetical protein FocTR4_00016573 [Fusarium oxysporum f. sp. cubense]